MRQPFQPAFRGVFRLVEMELDAYQMLKSIGRSDIFR